MSWFNKQKVKDAVDNVVSTAVDSAKDIMTQSTQEKMDIWGDVAKIGIFALLAFGAIKSTTGPKFHRRADEADFRTMTINNYYYSDPSKRRKA